MNKELAKYLAINTMRSEISDLLDFIIAIQNRDDVLVWVNEMTIEITKKRIDLLNQAVYELEKWEVEDKK